MALITYTPSPAKATSCLVELDKSILFAINSISSDAFWSDNTNIQTIVVWFKSVEGGEDKVLRMDPLQATPSASMAISATARDSFQLKAIMLLDFDDGRLILKRETLNTEVPGGIYAFDFVPQFDTSPPTPTSSVITVDQLTANSMRVNWSLAVDNVTPQSQLKYRVILPPPGSASGEWTIPSNIDAWGQTAWLTNVTNAVIPTLVENTYIPIVVVVKDNAENIGLINETPFEALTGESVPPLVGTWENQLNSFTSTSLILNPWPESLDDNPPITYKLFYSTDSAKVTQYDTAIAQATDYYGAWAAYDSGLKSIDGLQQAVPYYFNVFAKDSLGNITQDGYGIGGSFGPFEIPDTTPPTVGLNLTFTNNIGKGGDNFNPVQFTANWGIATDNVTPQASLQYWPWQVNSAYVSTVTAEDLLTAPIGFYGNPLSNDWLTNVISYNYSSSESFYTMSEGESYYVTIIVRDATGNSALYSPQQIAIPDTIPPLVPSGDLLNLGIGDYTIQQTFLFSVALDPNTSSVDSSYEYRAFYCKVGEGTLDTYQDMVTNGIPAFPWRQNTESDTFTIGPDPVNFTPQDFAYLVNLAVRDQAGNISIYTPTYALS